MKIENKLVEENVRYHPSCYIDLFWNADDKKPVNVSKVIILLPISTSMRKLISFL